MYDILEKGEILLPTIKPLCPVCFEPYPDHGFSGSGVTCSNCLSTYYVGHLTQLNDRATVWELTQHIIKKRLKEREHIQGGESKGE